MRIFVGIYPEETLRNQFRSVKQSFNKYKRNFKFIANDQIHMTVKFLGNNVSFDTYDQYVKQLKIDLEQLKSFEYKLAKTSFGFIGQAKPNIILTQVAPSPELIELTRVCTNASKKLRLNDIVAKKEQNKLIHHFTLARLKSNTSKRFAEEINDFITELKLEPLVAKANKVVIVQSTLTNTGPIYKILNEINLQEGE